MLFEKTDTERIQYILYVLETERAMRVKVFKDKPDIQRTKLMEIDSALADLKVISERLGMGV